MAEEKKQEVAITFGDQLVSQLEYAEKALPGDFNRTRFVQNTLSVLNSNPALTKCTRSSLLSALMKGAFLGLDFMKNEAYVIPYQTEATFQTSYLGEVKFVKKYSVQPIKDIYAKIVRKGDEFVEKIEDGKPSIDFKPIPFNGDEVIGAFAVCLFADGTMMYETMSIQEIQAVRNNYSKQSQGPAWKKSPEEMYKKVVIRRLTKHIPTDFESVEAHNAWEDGSGMEFTNTSSAIDKSEVVNAFAPKEEEEVIDVEAEVIETPEVFK